MPFQDICELNIVINYYRLDRKYRNGLQGDLHVHRRSEDVLYALMDFNQSIQLPPDVGLKTCKRPYEESLYGSPVYKPDDVGWGAAVYYPFAWDVALLGNMFRYHFSV